MDFDTFWDLYPRKVGKLHARKAWDKAIKSGVEPELMIESLRHYRFSHDMTYVKHPSTWLNAGCYLDEPDEQPKSAMVHSLEELLGSG